MEAEKWTSAHVRTAQKLDWPAWIERVNEYLARMHALFWPDLFILGGAVSERFDEFAPLLRSAARDPAGALRRAGGRDRRGAGRGRAHDALTACAAASCPTSARRSSRSCRGAPASWARSISARDFPDYDIDPRLTRARRRRRCAQGHNQYAPMEGVIDAARSGSPRSCSPAMALTRGSGDARSPSPSAPRRRSTPPSRRWSVPGDEVDRVRSGLRLLRAGGPPRRRALRATSAAAAGVSLRLGSRCARASTPARGSCSSTARTIRPAPPPAPRISMRSRTLIRERDILVLSDEVYEHVVYDGAQACTRC